MHDSSGLESREAAAGMNSSQPKTELNGSMFDSETFSAGAF